MARIYGNFHEGTLTSGITDVATSIVVTWAANASEPADFSSGTMTLVIDPEGAEHPPEVVLASAYVGATNTFTVTRAQEGSTAQTFDSGRKIVAAVSKAALDEFLTTNTAQTITGAKTFSSAITANGGVTGALTGNVTGTADVATTVTLGTSSDTTCFPLFVETATGNQGAKTDSGKLTYNASTGTLSATNLAGTLTSSSQTSITGVGTITTGTWEATDVAVAHGGTGSSTASGARTNLGVAIGSNVQAYSSHLDALTSIAKTNSNFVVGNGTTWVSESPSTARTSLGVAIGSDVQAYSANLNAIAGLAATNSNFIVGNGSTWVAESGATARTSLGLGTADNVEFNQIQTNRYDFGSQAAGDSWITRAAGNDYSFRFENVNLAGWHKTVATNSGSVLSSTYHTFQFHNHLIPYVTATGASDGRLLGDNNRAWNRIVTKNGSYLSSDATLKDIGGTAPGMDFMRMLTGYEWSWKADDDGSFWGPTAQDIQAAVDASGSGAEVVTGEEGNLTVRMDALWGPVINALKELDARIQALEV